MRADDEGLSSFRSEVRAFLAESVPQDVRAKALGGFEFGKEEIDWWHSVLFKKGWAAPAWSKEYGGQGWSIPQLYAFEEESCVFGAPQLIPVATGMVGPILISCGTQEQKARFLPRILDGSEFWCQGLSEPGSGSDLASLSCKARREGDKYIINGTKIWTSFAQWAEWCLMLVRTDDSGRKQHGITILLLDMKTPGIEIRPIISIDGMHTLNQVFFTDVETPVALRIGEENEGWTILKNNIGLERVFNGGPSIGEMLRQRLITTARRKDATGRRAMEKPWFRDALAQIDVRLAALESVLLGVLTRGNLAVLPEASLIKARGTEIQQDILRLQTEIVGSQGFVYDRAAIFDGSCLDASEEESLAPLVPHYLFMRKASISSGTNEIQRDIIARHVLGSPK